MIVTLVVLMAVATIIWPNLVRESESRQRREFFNEIARLAGRARELAIMDKRTYAISMDTSGRRFLLIQDDEDEGEIERQAVSILDGIETGTFSADGGTPASAEWRLNFYPDGTSDGGGIELTDAGRPRSLEVRPEGTIRLVDGPLEEMGSEKWPAGEYERRI